MRAAAGALRAALAEEGEALEAEVGWLRVQLQALVAGDDFEPEGEAKGDEDEGGAGGAGGAGGGGLDALRSLKKHLQRKWLEVEGAGAGAGGEGAAGAGAAGAAIATGRPQPPNGDTAGDKAARMRARRGLPGRLDSGGAADAAGAPAPGERPGRASGAGAKAPAQAALPAEVEDDDEERFFR
jgi:hypothetical protein